MKAETIAGDGRKMISNPSLPQWPQSPPSAQASRLQLDRQDESGASLRLRIRFTGYSIWKFRQDFTWPLHQHRDYEIIVPREGTYRCTLNGESVALTSGRMLLVKPGDQHADHCERAVTYFGVNFRIEDAISEGAALPLFNRETRPTAQIVTVPAEIGDAFARKMAAADDMTGIAAAHIQDALATELFWRLVPRLSLEALSSQFRAAFGKQDFRMRLERVFMRHLSRSLSLSEMAMQLGVSTRTLSAHCQQFLRQSPARLFRDYKLRHAAALLRTTNRPVKEISYLLGFPNPYHFSRSFKSWSGASPTRFRLEGAREDCEPGETGKPFSSFHETTCIP